MATANLGFEEKLWQMADKLRGSWIRVNIKMLYLDYCFKICI